jgi:hypothetical protein
LVGFALVRPVLVFLTLFLFYDVNFAASLHSFDVNSLVPQSKKKATISHRQKTMISKHHRKSVQRPGTGETHPPNASEMNKAGSSITDLRDLPPTPPEKKERPQRQDPNIVRKVYRKPGVRKHN